MFEKLKHRYIACLSIILVIFSLMAVRLYRLVAAGEQSSGQNSRQASVSVPGKRGAIYDANNVLLAYDQESYEVTFYRDPANNASSDRANYTQILLETIEMIEGNGDSVIDTFLIVRDAEGNFAYDISEDLSEETRKERISSWCANMQLADDTMEPRISIMICAAVFVFRRSWIMSRRVSAFHMAGSADEYVPIICESDHCGKCQSGKRFTNWRLMRMHLSGLKLPKAIPVIILKTI